MHKIDNFCILDRWAVIRGYIEVMAEWPLEVVISAPNKCTVIWRSMLQRGGAKSMQTFCTEDMGDVSAEFYLKRLQRNKDFVKWFNDISGACLNKEAPTSLLDVEWCGVFRYRNDSLYNVKTMEAAVEQEKSKEAISLCKTWYMPGGGGIDYNAYAETLIEQEGERGYAFRGRTFNDHAQSCKLLCRALKGYTKMIDKAIKEREK